MDLFDGEAEIMFMFLFLFLCLSRLSLGGIAQQCNIHGLRWALTGLKGWMAD